MAADTRGDPAAIIKGPPYKAKAIANYFLERGQKEGVALSQMKLQKLVYFAHGWHLALIGGPLIDERVQAWEFGPVIRTIYDEFKGYGKDTITSLAESADIQGTTIRFFEPAVPESDVETRQLLDRVWEVYKGFSAYQLSNLTHSPDSPWDTTYTANPGVRNLTIDDNEISEYFKRIADDNRKRRSTG